MLHDVPDWASRHNVRTHSNPRSKDRAKTFWQEHVRPIVGAAFDVLRDTQLLRR